VQRCTPQAAGPGIDGVPMLQVRVESAPGLTTVQCSVEQLATGHALDFGSSSFSAAPATQWSALAELALWPGIYALDLSTPQSAWPDGDYAVYVRDTARGTAALAALPIGVVAGDAVAARADARTQAILSGSVAKDGQGDLTWSDASGTARVKMTPDGAGGYTSTLL
jgi:hypothetical protein